MAKDVLVAESLSDSMISAGAELIARLDAEKSEVKSVFWFYLSEDKLWKLIIASPLVDSQGPREYYKKILRANNSAAKNEQIISLHNIGVTSTEDQIIQILQLDTSAKASGTRLSKHTIAGVFIEDSYIYRS